MQHTSVNLNPLETADREQFILDNQRAFWYGTMQEFGMRDEHPDSQGKSISRKSIKACSRKNTPALYLTPGHFFCKLFMAYPIIL